MIIDSGASDHITGSSKYNSSDFPASGKGIADGSLCSVAWKERVCSFSTSIFYFESVFHVANFPLNLLSISSINPNSNLKPKEFFLSVTEDGKMIGNGRVKEGNYMLEANLSKLTELSSKKEHWNLGVQ